MEARSVRDRWRAAVGVAATAFLAPDAGAIEDVSRVTEPVPAVARETGGSDWIHRASGIRLPESLAGYRRAGSTSRGGTDVDVVYEHERHEPIRVSIYRATISPAWTIGRLEGHFRELLPRSTGGVPGLKSLVLSRVEIPVGAHRWKGRRATKRIMRNGIDESEILDVFLVGEDFVSFRSTVRGRSDPAGLDAIARALQAFPWPQP